MSGWLQGIVAVASLLFAGGGLAGILNVLFSRKGRRAEVADRLSDSSLKWVEQFQEETARARTEAAESRAEASAARREVAELRREVAIAKSEAEGLARDLRDLRGAILSPSATLDRLRAMVGGPTNGRV